MNADREKLPLRRASENISVEVAGLKFTATVSRYSDGRPAEIFLDNNRASSFAGIMAGDAAIAASLALQYGCPVEVLRKALSRDARAHPLSPLGVTLDVEPEVRR
jgi:hypothetical protein